jgi:hypothetical protein
MLGAVTHLDAITSLLVTVEDIVTQPAASTHSLDQMLA